VNAERPAGLCEHAHDDGAYVLGALSPDDRLAFERHLPSCAACTESVRELAGLPGLLARVPVAAVDPDQLPTPVPDTLLPALVREARRTERRRAWLTATLVGVAAAAVVAAAWFAVRTDGDDPVRAVPTSSPSAPSAAVSTAPPELMQPVGDTSISGWLSLTEVGWGTRLDLTCSYATDSQNYDDPSWSTYAMYVHTADGAVEQVASWRALPGKTMQLSGATAALRADITSVEVRTSSGERVLELS
jgi:Putative zinc-finger